jgi:hypothetical protein
VLDGVFADGGGDLTFVPADEVTDLDVAEALATIVPHVRALLARRGCGGDDDAPDAFLEGAPTLASMAAAAVQGTTAMGRRAGARTRRCGEVLAHAGATPLARCHADQDGFDLEAGVHVRADQRDRLERLCRYVLRPPVAGERLRVLDDGDLLLALQRRWSDGTTHLRFSPAEFLERLAVLIPRPRINLVSYHGVLPFDVAQGTPSPVEGWGPVRPGGRGSSPSSRARRRPLPPPSQSSRSRLTRRAPRSPAARAGLTSCVEPTASMSWRVPGVVAASG